MILLEKFFDIRSIEVNGAPIQKGNDMSTRLDLKKSLARETHKFEEFFVWLEKSMPAPLYEELSGEEIELVVHNLMDLHLQGYFASVHFLGSWNRDDARCTDIRS